MLRYRRFIAFSLLLVSWQTLFLFRIEASFRPDDGVQRRRIQLRTRVAIKLPAFLERPKTDAWSTGMLNKGLPSVLAGTTCDRDESCDKACREFCIDAKIQRLDIWERDHRGVTQQQVTVKDTPAVGGSLRPWTADRSWQGLCSRSLYTFSRISSTLILNRNQSKSRISSPGTILGKYYFVPFLPHRLEHSFILSA